MWRRADVGKVAARRLAATVVLVAVVSAVTCSDRTERAPGQQTPPSAADAAGANSITPAGEAPIDLIGGARWDCLPDAEVGGGEVVVRGPTRISINDFTERLVVRGDFSISARFEAEGELAGITFWNALPPAQTEAAWHASAPRVQVSLRSGAIYFAMFDGTSARPVHQYAPPKGAGGPRAVTMRLRKTSGGVALDVDGVEVSRSGAAGPLVDGPLYMGVTVGASSRLTIRELRAAGVAGQGEVRVERSPMQAGVSERRQGESLRELLSRRGRVAGVGGVNPTQFRWAPGYRALVASEFSSVAPGAAFDWQRIHPSRDRYNFCDSDQVVAFAKANGMQVEAKFLTWGNNDPEWLNGGGLSRAELLDVLHRHIETVMGRYRGRVAIWEVGNEVLDYEYLQTGRMRETVWSRGIGPDYLDQAFRWAREADPEAVLILNEVAADGMDRKADGFFELVRGLRTRGVPIDGVGLQMHWPVIGGKRQGPEPEAIAANMQRFAELGLAVYVTEMDLPVREPATPQLLAAQAQVYRDVLAVCLAAPNCKGFTVWGAYDGDSWLRARPRFDGLAAPLLFDEAFRAKPAYEAIIGLLKSQ